MLTKRELQNGSVAVLLLGVLSGLLAAQSASRPASTSQAPLGWKIRVDRSTSATDPDAPGPVKFLATGTGFHAVDPQAAVFWNPANVIGGSYALRGTFTLLAPSNHTNYYGLVFGGKNLDGPAQRYVYFLVAQDGTWLVKRRDGDAVTQTLLAKTPSPSVRVPAEDGRSINVLEARVTPGAIVFIVNGTVVNTWYGAGRVIPTDGIYGIRVNHFLDVEADRFAAVALTRLVPSPSLDDSDGPGAAAETVAITGPVQEVLSRTVFSMAGPNGQQVTVFAPGLQRAVERSALVTALGRRSPAGDTRVPPGEVRAWSGSRPIVTATSVLAGDLVDLTKRLPPPATAEEEALDGIMKQIAPAFTALRAAVDGSNADEARQRAVVLQQAFADVESFWAKQSRADAVGWARTARGQSASIARAAAANEWTSARSATDVLGQQCQACHAMYRDAFDDGLFRIKKLDR
jgi:hypothetical protein